MILYSSIHFNPFSSTIYNEFIKNLDLNQFICPKCGAEHSLILYGHYVRSFHFEGELFNFKVQRVFCNHCHSTHAILPSFIVPYSQYPLSAFVQILDPDIDTDSISVHWQISLESIRRIRHQFQLYWKKLLPDNWLDLSFSDLSSSIFKITHRQFFQNRFLFLSFPT